jgi:hypothetical protein
MHMLGLLYCFIYIVIEYNLEILSKPLDSLVVHLAAKHDIVQSVHR